MEAALGVHAAAVVADATVGHTLIQIWQTQADSTINTYISLKVRIGIYTCVRVYAQPRHSVLVAVVWNPAGH